MYNMDSPNVTSPDEATRIKFLCSFGGSILPRPQDGKLRYVGGETRIVSLTREINYEELMLKMKELFYGASLLKYQQPDEDIDALVSVVNDDDVTNMMEEYDKVGSGDGFTRLRMFLFPSPDYDSSPVAHFETDDRETGRKYVDALNSLDGSPEYRRQHSPESPVTGAGQHQIETPWSPAYYSPRHHGHHDPRPITEYPSSPSSSRYRVPFGEVPDQMVAPLPPPYEHQPPFVENVARLPPGPIPVDKGGFPGNLSNTQSLMEGGNSICNNCRMTFQRSQNESACYPDSRWKQPYLEPPPNMGSEFHQFANLGLQCSHNREAYVLNTDARLDHGVYPKEQNEPLTFYTDAHTHERGWGMHHQMSYRGEEPRSHISGGRMNEHYVVDGTNMNLPPLHGTCGDRHQTSSTCINHEDPRYIRLGPELGNEGFHEQAVGVRPQIHIPVPEDRGVRFGNVPSVYGTDNLYQVSHGPAPAPAPAPALWIKVQNPMHSAPSYEALNMLPQANSTASSGFALGVQESGSSFRGGLDSQNPWTGNQQQMFGFDGSESSKNVHGYAPKLKMSTLGQENGHPFISDPVCPAPDMLDLTDPAEPVSQVAVIDKRILASTAPSNNLWPTNVTCASEPVSPEEKGTLEEGSGMTSFEKVDLGMQNNSSPNRNEVDQKLKAGFDSNGLLPSTLVGVENMKLGETDDRNTIDPKELSVNRLSFLPELIASVKKAALEGAEEVKTRLEGEVEGDVDSSAKGEAYKEYETANIHDVEVDSDSDHKNISNIEPTKAEEEALSRGLQTIKNDDLEEISELGSGTYGAVFHGKWKGSNVAIKRIKGSCFAGRPSERERLVVFIADFWKEALILSSLHHPNVVSFYGIVRDGPDGSLATVTEFMVNGSLKQFIQKKDRTIDRRKRLIIAMDAAFGMEYLHGKNIVHFDLKCENLLVNMRDPHRPVCKIGDLGLSKVKQQTLVSGGVRGTLPWMAPELLSGKSNMVTEKIDVYSFGIVMWELLTGEEPYADMRCASLIGGIVHNSLRPEVPSWCDPEWKALMESCWDSEPGERPSFSEISQKLRKMSATINVK